METCWSCAAAVEPGQGPCRICGAPESSIDPTLVQPPSDPGTFDPAAPPTAAYPPAAGAPPYAAPPYAQPGYSPPGPGSAPAPGYAPPGAPPSGYPAAGYAPSHYAQPGYPPPGSGYPPPGYGLPPAAGYPPPGYGYAPVYPVAVVTPPKSKAVAALLCFFLGGFGIHRFYTGQVGLGVALLLTTLVLGPLTFGLWYFVTFIWVIVDFILILVGSVDDQYGRPLV